MSIETKIQSIVDELTIAVGDANKFDRGNASAGTRVRKAAMAATKGLKAVRTEVQEIKNS
ncbi:MAG TPA: histone H1 [Myxococcales bacterium]|nr:histone H1 [Myxococcales bacterium]